MPLYHFDTIQDGELSPDDEGLEFSSLDVACDEAVRALGEMARDRLRCRDRQEIAISIRDGGLMPLFTASLVLTIEPKR
jgi:hypothetical protein